jgi:hypothetical protein
MNVVNPMKTILPILLIFCLAMIVAAMLETAIVRGRSLQRTPEIAAATIISGGDEVPPDLLWHDRKLSDLRPFDSACGFIVSRVSVERHVWLDLDNTACPSGDCLKDRYNALITRSETGWSVMMRQPETSGRTDETLKSAGLKMAEHVEVIQ